MTFLWLPDGGLWPYYPDLYKRETYKRTSGHSEPVQTHTTLTRNILTAPFKGLGGFESVNPLQLSPLYGLFVREHPLNSLGTLLRLDFSVCNPPVLVKKPKDPVLTIPWEKE
jgi:hypothetical protein